MTNIYPGVRSYGELLRFGEDDNPRIRRIIESYFTIRFEVEYRRFIESHGRDYERV